MFHGCLRTGVLLIAILAIAGCGRGKRETANLSGKVSFKGQPVPEGFINFLPDVPGGNKGEVKGFPIKDGVYDTAQGKNPGIYPGANKIMVSGFNGKAKQLWPQGEQIFNPIESDLTVAAGSNKHDIEVPASAGQNVKIVPTADPPGK